MGNSDQVNKYFDMNAERIKSNLTEMLFVDGLRLTRKVFF